MPEQLQRITGERDRQHNTTTAFLLYHGRSHVTGNRLGDFLGIPHGRDCNNRYDYLIRWGSRTSVGYRPRETVVNSMESLRQNTDKLQTLRRLDNAGVPVPEYTTNRDEISDTFGYPALGRAEQHTRGQDINLILQWRDAYLTDGNDYFVEYVPTDLEYRMHVIDGEVVKIHEKRLRSDEDNHPFLRNHETGWIFVDPREQPPDSQLAIDAVGALGLDFGAVDMIMGEDGNPYVLEVNSAPSLDEANLRRYGEQFAETVGLDDYPGLNNVEWDDEDNTEEEPADDDGDDEGLGELFG